MNHSIGILCSALLVCTPALGAPAAEADAKCEARNLDFADKSAGWSHLPLSKLKRDTVYRQAQEGGRTVLIATADRSASLYVARFKQPATVPARLSWRWRTGALVPGADNRDKKREDAPLRVIVAFDGDRSTLPEVEQKRFRQAKALSGRESPYATLMYIWSDHVPPETVIPSAHTGQLKMLVVASGAGGLGSWQSVSRNLAADFRRAYGAEPGRLLGVAVMTDTDNTGAKVVGEYADLRLACTSD